MNWQETLSWPRLLLFLGLVFLLITVSRPYARQAYQNLRPVPPEDKEVASWCQLPQPVTIPDARIASSLALLDESSLQLQVQRLSAAVNVSTVRHSADADLHKAYEQLHQVLERDFPLV